MTSGGRGRRGISQVATSQEGIKILLQEGSEATEKKCEQR